MDKQVDPAVQERIRALCRQITVAHDLDPEIQEELYGHMEDKLLAYLAGEEKLSPDDAFILVEKHFGDPSALKVLLEDVHYRNVYVSLARRLAAALVATAALGLLRALIAAPLTVLIARVLKMDTVAAFAGTAFGLWLLTELAALGLLWSLLVRWQRQLKQGQTLWFVRWPSHWMLVAVGVALIAGRLIPTMDIAASDKSQLILALAQYSLAFYLPITMYGIIVGQACAWLWWSDYSTRSPVGLLGVALCWIALRSVNGMAAKLVPSVMVGAHAPSLFLGTPIDSLTHGSVYGTPLQWWLAWPEAPAPMVFHGHQMTYLQTLSFSWVVSVGLFACMTLLAWIVYQTARFTSARITGRYVKRQPIY